MIPITVSFKGEYRISILENNHVVYESPWFDNLITNAGLDQIGIGDYALWCALGTSTIAPTVTDTALGSFLVSSDVITLSLAAPNKLTKVFLFDVNTVDGIITEVGIGWNASCTPIFSRTLVPRAIKVGLYQKVIVTYTLNLIPPITDYAYSIQVKGGEFTSCVARAAYVGDTQTEFWSVPGTQLQFGTIVSNAPRVYDGSIGAIDAFPSGTEVKTTSITVYEYIPGTYYIDMQCIWNLSLANFKNGISAAMFLTNGYGAYQISFVPPLIKTCYHEIKLKFRVSWSRIT